MNGSDVGKMSPLGDRVLLRALEAKKETDGGVILATDEAERPTLGKVREEERERKEREKRRKRDDEIRTSSRIFLPLPPIKWEQRIEDAPVGRLGGLKKASLSSLRGSVTIYRDIYISFNAWLPTFFLFFLVFFGFFFLFFFR